MYQNNVRAQIAVEYVILVGLLLVILIPLFYYSLSTSSEKVKLSQAESTIFTLGKAVEEVYSLSPGTKKYVWISIPGGVQGASINGSEITMIVSSAGKSSDYTAFTKARVIGNIPTQRGVYRVPIELLESGVVQIGSATDVTPPQVVWVSPSGTTCNPITLRANTDEAAACKYDTGDTSYFAMRYTLEGNALGHSDEVGVQAEGSYLYLVRCADAFGNTMNSSALINYSIDYVSCSGQPAVNDTVPPSVTLENPSGGSTTSSSKIDFYYRVTDAFPILLCRLYANNSLINTVIDPSRNVTNNITGNLNQGVYSWSVNCTDGAGNQGNSTTRLITVNATLDSDTPIVQLILPANGSIQKLNTVKFSYNVTDATSAISSCWLSTYGVLDAGSTAGQTATAYNVPPNSRQNFTLTLNKGNYVWNVTCQDSSIYNNQGISTTRSFRVNQSSEETVITSCAGRCWFEGYSDGVCRQEPPKCTQNGEVYLAAGNGYCTGGSQSDTCCCKP